MILRILSRETESKPADELMFESKTFLIRRAEDKPIDPNFDCELWECGGAKPLWLVSHDGVTYMFNKAYLMNNDGKTIEKYGQ